MTRPLKTHLTLTYSALILVFALVLSLFVEQVATERLRAEAGSHLGELAFQIADKLDRGMFERYRDLAVASTVATVTDEEAGLTIRRDWLEKLQSTYPYYKWIGYADLSGTVVVSVNGLLEGQSVAARPWFSGGLKSVFYGDVHKAMLLEQLLPASDEPWRFVDVAVPVRDQAGEVAGVLGSHLSWGWADEVRESVLLSESGQHEGLVLSNDNKVLLGPPELVGKSLDLELLNEPSAKPGHGTERWPDGKRYVSGLVSSEGYREFPGLGWRVLVRESEETAFASIETLRWQILGGGVLLSGLFFVISARQASRIARPLQALTAAADRLQGGAREIEFPAQSDYREGDRLARSLRALLEQFIGHEKELMILNTDLESRVKARTAELEAEISERRRVQAFLERSEASLRTITDSVPALIGYLDRTQSWRFANRAFSDWFHIDPSTLLGRHVARTLTAEEYSFLEPRLLEAYSGQTVRFDAGGTRSTMPAHMDVNVIPDVATNGEVIGVYLVVHDVTTRKEQELLLAREVCHDALTGLLNRKGLNDRLELAVQRAARTGDAIAVMFLDLDRFKSVNDTFGHGAGDLLLKTVSQRLVGTVRATDTVARLAGDEFVVVLEGLTGGKSDAERVAQKLVAAISATLEVAGQEVQPSTSIGIAVDHTGKADAAELMHKADKAMYQAKHHGRNTFRFYQPGASSL